MCLEIIVLCTKLETLKRRDHVSRIVTFQVLKLDYVFESWFLHLPAL